MDSTGNIDRQRVTLASEIECLYWETKLGAARGDIRAGIDAVGAEPAAVDRWLQSQHRCHIRPVIAPPA